MARYTAFISYKHAPADIAVARDVQRRLEHFHVPRAIRRKTGRQRIERIFRDKEELPITSSLGKDISQALEDAEYLIVVCSTSTKLSTWVPREIEQFLQTHDHDHVLTVLVDGDPEDVVPKALLEHGAEPLCCDYRDIKQARKSEITRLAAALLGCGYDELVMRARQYRMRRLGAFAAAGITLAAVAIGYLIWSNDKIRTNYQRAEENRIQAEENYRQAEENRFLAEENYRAAEANLLQARENQSKNLANQALKALKTEDRMLAAKLALAALPDEQRPDWPVTADAVHALNAVIRTYQQPQQSIEKYFTGFSDNTDLHTVFELTMPGEINGYLVSSDGRRLYVSDDVGNAAGWDLTDYTSLFMRDLGVRITSLMEIPSADGYVLGVENGYGLYALNGSTGEDLWRYKANTDNTFQAYVENGQVFVLDEHIYDHVYHLGRMGRLDPVTGRCVSRGDYFCITDKSIAIDMSYALSKEGDALLLGERDYADDGQALIWRYDLATGEMTSMETELQVIYDIEALEDGKLIALGVKNWGIKNLALGDLIENRTLIQTQEVTVICLDRRGNVQWRQEFAAQRENQLPENCLLTLVDHTGNTGEHKYVQAAYGDGILWLDRENGSVIDHIRVGESAMSVKVLDQEQGVVALLQSGRGAFWSGPDENANVRPWLNTQMHSGLLFSADQGDTAALAKTEKNTLRVYGRLYDGEYVPFAGAVPTSSIAHTVVGGQSFVVLEEQMGESTATYTIYDLQARRLAVRLTLPFYLVKRMYVTPDNVLLVVPSYKGEITTVDPRTGTFLDTLPLEDWVSDGSMDCCAEGGSRAYALIRRQSKTDPFGVRLCSLEVGSDGTIRMEQPVTLSEDLSVRGESLYCSSDGKLLAAVLKAADGQRTVLLSADGRTWHEADGSVTAQVKEASFLADRGLVVLNCRDKALVFTMDGRLSYEIQYPYRAIDAALFASAAITGGEDLLLTVTSEGLLHRYAAETGTYSGSTQVEFEDALSTKYVYDSAVYAMGGDLLIHIRNLANCIDTKEWKCTAAMPMVFEYDPENELLFTWNIRQDGQYDLVVYHPYSLEELISRGRALLRGMTFTESEKDSYGIE